MIFSFRNKATGISYVLVNKNPWIKVMEGHGLSNLLEAFPESVLFLSMKNMKEIKDFLKVTTPLVKDQPELHLGEIIQNSFP
jgi:hypothetical protein